MYLGRTIEELHELLVKKEVTPLELTKEALEALKKENTNLFLAFIIGYIIEFAICQIVAVPYISPSNKLKKIPNKPTL